MVGWVVTDFKCQLNNHWKRMQNNRTKPPTFCPNMSCPNMSCPNIHVRTCHVQTCHVRACHARICNVRACQVGTCHEPDFENMNLKKLCNHILKFPIISFVVIIKIIGDVIVN